MRPQTQAERRELLRLEKMCASNQKSTILRDIDLTIFAGEICGIVSTSEFLLQKFTDALAGLITMTSGAMYLQGRRVTPGERTAGRILFVCQETQLFGEFTGIHNIFINDRGFYRLSHRGKRRLAQQVREEFGLDFDLNADVRNLTAEERKIVEVLRAWNVEAPVVVLHDTFNTVGVEYIPCLRRIIDKMIEKGKGICYVSTDVEDILSFSHRIAMLDGGRIKGVFETEQVIDNPRKVMRLISGWEELTTELESDGLNSRMLDALVKSREINVSSMEIRQVIHVLSLNIRQAMGSDGCVIYLIDEESNSIINSLYPEEMAEAPRLAGSFIRAQSQNTQVMAFRDCEGLSDAFQEPVLRAGSMACINVFSNGKQVGFIQVWFRERENLSSKRFHYLTSFARDVSIAVETSRLMGRSVLLQESHHRIKNNLQVIINLIYIQKMRLIQQDFTPQELNAVLDAIIERVKSIAVVHDMFSTNKLGQGSISLRVMTLKILNMYRMADVTYETAMDEVSVPYSKATSIALVINELFSNCMKHAFPTQWPDKRVRLEFYQAENAIVLTVRDNGVGMPPDFNAESCDSLGIYIIRSILAGMEGTLEYAPGPGTRAQVWIPLGSFYK